MEEFLEEAPGEQSFKGRLGVCLIDKEVKTFPPVTSALISILTEAPQVWAI